MDTQLYFVYMYTLLNGLLMKNRCACAYAGVVRNSAKVCTGGWPLHNEFAGACGDRFKTAVCIY